MIKAVVMAGGEGSRLRPITAKLPKPLVPICNRPILEHSLVLLRRHGITEIHATLHYLADEIQSHFGDGADFDVQLTYSIEQAPLGTAGSIKQAEASLRAEAPFLIVSGDALTDCDLTAAIAFHRKKKGLATLILAREPSPRDFGVVVLGREGRVERFLEKPGWSEVFSDTVNTGMYVLEPEVFDYIEPDIPQDWSADVFPRLLAAGKPIYGYVMDGYWADVGSLASYREAQEAMLRGDVDLPLDGATNTPGIWLGPNVSIEDSATLVPPVFLGRNCKIKRGAQVGPFSVLGDNAIVEEDARVERSVLWDGVYVGAGSVIESATICSRTTIKRDCAVEAEAVIGERCLLEAGATVRPQIKVWPDKTVERGSTLTMSLIWGNQWRGQLFRDLGVAGLSNIEITPDFATRLGSAYGSCLPRGAKVVTSRDSTRSSRMIKRALIAALLSVGCDVIDLRSAAVPVARHYIKRSGAAGAMNVRKQPGNARVSLVEMFDSRGAYLSRAMERKVETIFFREDFNRVDPDDLGVIDVSSHAVEEYRADFARLLPMDPQGKRRMRIVCDYGYSAVANIYPLMLAGMEIDAISLNSVNDAKLAPRTDPEIAQHVAELEHIVSTLGYEIGILFTEEGERLTVVNGAGAVLEGDQLFAAFGALLAETEPKGARVALPVTAPTRLEQDFRARGLDVVRTKADARSLMNTALEAGVSVAGDGRGGFVFPALHPGFDAMFAAGKILAMLRETGRTLCEVAQDLPRFALAYERARCPYDAKGAIMRRLAEEAEGELVETLDGLKIFTDDLSWVLLLPDSLEPHIHVYAEGRDDEESRALASRAAQRIESMVERRPT